ncbi:hypothetical protein BV22DRAFT_1025629, partial [Leucogyrophana mollusca]
MAPPRPSQASTSTHQSARRDIDSDVQLFSGTKRREDLIADPNQLTPIKNSDSTRKFLCEKGLILQAGLDTIETLSTALLEFCNTAPGLTALHKDTIRADKIEEIGESIERNKQSAETLGRITEEVSTQLERSAEFLEGAVATAVTHIDTESDID